MCVLGGVCVVMHVGTQYLFDSAYLSFSVYLCNSVCVSLCSCWRVDGIKIKGNDLCLCHLSLHVSHKTVHLKNE